MKDNTITVHKKENVTVSFKMGAQAMPLFFQTKGARLPNLVNKKENSIPIKFSFCLIKLCINSKFNWVLRGHLRCTRHNHSLAILPHDRQFHGLH